MGEAAVFNAQEELGLKDPVTKPGLMVVMRTSKAGFLNRHNPSIFGTM